MKALFFILSFIIANTAIADFLYSASNNLSFNWDQNITLSPPSSTISLKYVSTGVNSFLPTITGPDASKFVIGTNRCNNYSSTTSPCSLTIGLNRSIPAGTYSAVLNLPNTTSISTINLNAIVSAVSVSVGNSTQIEFIPSTLPQYTFDTYSTKTVELVLKNTGTKNISALSNFSWSNGDAYTKFSLERCAGKSLAVGKTCTVKVNVSKPPTSVNTALSYTADGATASISFDLIGQTPCLFNGKTYQNGQSVSGYSASTVPYGSTCSSVAVTGICQSGTITPSVASATCSVLPATRCTVDGRTFAHGSTVNGFSASTVPFGNSCSSIAVSGVCQSGTVTPSVAKLTCTVSPAASCSLNGQTIPHGQSVQAYASSSVSFGSTCVGETRTCSNGVLSGSNAFSSCSVQSAATCSFGGQTYQHGQSILGYSVATVPFGQTCSAFTSMGLCQNGTITNQPTSATCSETQPLTCEFNGQTIQSGGTVEAFETSSVPFGETCKKEVRGCTNGVLTGTFTNTTCTVEAGATCSFNGQTYQHGASVPGFSSNTVAYGSLCSSVAVSGTCQNGNISNEPAFGSCSVNPPQSCLYNQQIIAHGSLASGYTQATAPFGSNCAVYATTSLCDNGSLISPPASASCEIGSPLSCDLSGQTILHESSIIAYQTSSVAFGGTCSGETRSCFNGVLSGSNNFLSCTVDQPLNCSYAGTTINHNSSVLGFSTNSVIDSTCSSIESSSSCQNGSIANEPASLCAEFNSPQNPNLTACDGSMSLPYSKQCFKSNGSSISSTQIADCSSINGPADLLFNSPSGTRTILAGLPVGFASQTYTCSEGQLLSNGTLSDVSCSSGYVKNGLLCESAPANTLGLKLAIDYEILTSQLQTECAAYFDFNDGNGAIRLPIRSNIGSDLNSPLSLSICNQTRFKTASTYSNMTTMRHYDDDYYCYDTASADQVGIRLNSYQFSKKLNNSCSNLASKLVSGGSGTSRGSTDVQLSDTSLSPEYPVIVGSSFYFSKFETSTAGGTYRYFAKMTPNIIDTVSPTVEIWRNYSVATRKPIVSAAGKIAFIGKENGVDSNDRLIVFDPINNIFSKPNLACTTSNCKTIAIKQGMGSDFVIITMDAGGTNLNGYAHVSSDFTNFYDIGWLGQFYNTTLGDIFTVAMNNKIYFLTNLNRIAYKDLPINHEIDPELYNDMVWTTNITVSPEFGIYVSDNKLFYVDNSTRIINYLPSTYSFGESIGTTNFSINQNGSSSILSVQRSNSGKLYFAIQNTNRFIGFYRLNPMTASVDSLMPIEDLYLQCNSFLGLAVFDDESKLLGSCNETYKFLGVWDITTSQLIGGLSSNHKIKNTFNRPSTSTDYLNDRLGIGDVKEFKQYNSKFYFKAYSGSDTGTYELRELSLSPNGFGGYDLNSNLINSNLKLNSSSSINLLNGSLWFSGLVSYEANTGFTEFYKFYSN